MTVADTPDPVYAQITVDQASVLEGGELTYTVNLVDANGNPVTVAAGKSVTVELDWSGIAANADDLVDFAGLPGSVTIGAGESAAPPFSVTTKVDAVNEYSEPLTVTISAVQDNGGVNKGFESLQISTSKGSASSNILDAPTISAVDGNGAATNGHVTVYEKGLDDASDSSETAAGTLRVTAATGLESIEINGITISLAQLQGLPSTPVSIVIANHGELTLTGFAPTATANGADAAWDINYSYTLTDEQQHAPGAGANEALKNIVLGVNASPVTGTDLISGSGTLGVLVIDDLPSVSLTGAGLNEVQVDESYLGTTASANFSGAFVTDFGADGEKSFEYSFDIVAGVFSGLVHTASGKNITLHTNATGGVEGRVDGSTDPDDLAFIITVDALGNVTLEQKLAVQHPDPSNHDESVGLATGSLGLKGTATDKDDDSVSVSIDVSDRFSFKDDGPVIGNPPAVTEIDEKYLSTGSEAGVGTTTVGADLDVNFGADGQGSLVFTAAQPELTSWLAASGNADITFSVNGSALTATRAGQSVFTVQLDVVNGVANYSFELQGSMKHLLADSPHDLTFNYQAIDADGDKAGGIFVVQVVDDAPKGSIVIGMDEDESYGPFTVSADARPNNIEIRETVDGPALVANPDGSYSVAHGTVVVNANGTLTYTPNDDYSNHGNPDELYVAVTEDNGPTVVTKVTVNVIPVADAPDLTVSAAEVTTPEDVAIALGLKSPSVTDNVDQNGVGVGSEGDNPELLGLISLSGIPAGAKLLDGAGAELVAADGSDITIILTDLDGLIDGQHLAELLANPPAGTLLMTKAQYEALQVLPPAESHKDFTVTVKVSSYEVDEQGDALVIGGNLISQESSATVKVIVEAVTDPVELTFTNGSSTFAQAMAEDSTFDLSSILNVAYPSIDGNSVADLDGSEERWFEVTGLPVGSVINGQTIMTIDQVVRINAPGLSSTSTDLPNMNITPPMDYSGGAVAVTVTLKAKDRDGDTPTANPAVEESQVTLNLTVQPAVDTPLVAGVITQEDIAVKFLGNVEPGDQDGSEKITAITIKDIPSGWTVVDHNGDPVPVVAGQVIVDPADVASGDYKNYSIKGAPHSSLDATLKLDISVLDEGNASGLTAATGTFTDIDLKIEVTPTAEQRVEDGSGGWVGEDSAGTGITDLTMIGDYSYTLAGLEDTWFNLGVEGVFNLGATGALGEEGKWSNEDTNEEVSALFTPTLKEGDGSLVNAYGSEFQYNDGSGWVVQIFGGDPIEVPLAYLDTLQFKAAPNFSGMFEIKVQTKTVDYDDDYPGDLTKADTKISGEATLENILIKPVADAVTATVTAHVIGNEDEAMPLSIRPKSSDPSETFNVTVSAISDGSTLTYGGQTITSTTTGLSGIEVVVAADGSWSVEFSDFKPNLGANMTIQAPYNSNDPFTLKVSTVSVDSLVIVGDPNSPYTSVSSPYELDILVTPKGIADKVDVELLKAEDQIFTESGVEANGGIKLTDLVTKAELKDIDGSEALTFKVTLPEGFSMSVGTVTSDGTWLLTPAQFAVATLVTPPNFSGTTSFEFYAISTENDGDSLTEKHDVTVRVQPSPEATINLATTIDEDVSAKLSFVIEQQNGDTDERLDEVWIKASDVDALNNDYSLTYGQSGVSLAAAAGNQPGIILDDGWYKLSGVAIDNIYAQGKENWAGSAEFDVRYKITDPSPDALSLPNRATDTTKLSDESKYTITVNPVTDQPTLGITDGSNTALTEVGAVEVKLNIGNVDGDYDGSEQLTRIIFENVPDGVIVEGAEYLGGGQWMLTPNPANAAFNNPLEPTVKLQVQHAANGLTDHQIKVTVITEDSNNGTQLTADQNITLSTNFTGPGSSELPAVIEQWEQTTFEPTEDAAFTLQEAIDGKIADGVVNNNFTITLTDLPAGSQVSGMTRTVINGQEVWTASGSGGNDALQSLLDNITVTPPEDFNANKGDFTYNAGLTTYVPSGVRFEEKAPINQQVVPVTDDANILINAPAVKEGSTVDINISISNSADDPQWTLVDDKLYLTLNEAGDMLGGQLQDANGNPLTTSTVTGVDGVPNGDYYVIEVPASKEVELKYQPSAGHVSGTVGVSVIVKGQEAGSALVESTTVVGSLVIEAVNSGYDFTVVSASGDENSFAQAQADNSNLIEIQLTDNGLIDTDGSETVGSILLKNLPNGFLVFVGDSAGSAQQAEPGINAGANADGSNTWLLGNGALPGYIGIMPPAHWSGTIEDLQLIVNSKEAGLDDEFATVRDFDLVVNPVADGVTLNPTPSFGKEGSIITLNLNAEMKDLQEIVLDKNGVPGPADSSVETVNLQLKGLGEHAGFYIGEDLISDGSKLGYTVTYNAGVYTITGLTQEDLGHLGFKQAGNSVNNVEVRAQTVESANNAQSDWTHAENDSWASVTTIISKQFGTPVSDTLLWTGDVINGRGGDDTIQLRFGESLSSSELAANLKNIEVIDLGIAGANQVGDAAVGLSIQDVLDMTDSRDALKIDGDSLDSVFLSNEWTTTGTSTGGYITYSEAGGATVNISDLLNVQLVD